MEYFLSLKSQTAFSNALAFCTLDKLEKYMNQFLNHICPYIPQYSVIASDISANQSFTMRSTNEEIKPF